MPAWAAIVTDGGQLFRSGPAAMKHTDFGLLGYWWTTPPALYVEDDSPRDERRYRARFWIEPKGFDPGEAEGHLRTRIVHRFRGSPTRRVAAVVVRRLAGVYSLMGRARLDDNSQADTASSRSRTAARRDRLQRGSKPAHDGWFAL